MSGLIYAAGVFGALMAALTFEVHNYSATLCFALLVLLLGFQLVAQAIRERK